VINFPDPDGSGKPLVEMILDKAGAKGTGKWTTQRRSTWASPFPPSPPPSMPGIHLRAEGDQRVKAASKC
jgi:6-phosphogluconate dehydrogenase